MKVLATVAAVVGMAGMCIGSVSHDSRRDNATVGLLEISGSPMEAPGPLDWLFGAGDERTLRDLVQAIDDAGENEDLTGIVIRLKDASLGATQVEELGAAILRARGAGKRVHVFGEAYGMSDLLLGAYADEVIVQAGGAVSAPGLHMKEMFLADTLAWVGAKADMVQIGDYKGASEQMSRNAPSPEWDENISSLLDSLYGHMRGTLSRGRSLNDSQLDHALSIAWMCDGEQAAEVGLLDSQTDLSDLSEHLEGKYGVDSIAWNDELLPETDGPDMASGNPFAIFSALSAAPDHTPEGPSIAVLHISGVIIDGDSTSGGMMGEPSVGSRTIRNAIEDIMAEDDILGVVVRIDSPGGSASASEVIWRGLERLAEEKPVWVSVGSMAASGGYYIAVGGDKIYVNPSSIVGSIGVVGGKVSLSGVYSNLKVRVVERSRGPRAGLFSTTTGWSESDRAIVRGEMQRTYDLFIRRVTEGREGIELSRTAEGRLFTGDRAVELHMADEIGGLHDAISDMADDLGLEEYGVMDYPGPMSLDEFIEDALGGFLAQAKSGGDYGAAVASMAREIVGEEAWPEVARGIQGLGQLREHPVILMSPRVLIFR